MARSPDPRLRFGIFLPPFDAYAEPATVAALAADAERAGWDGFFFWDHAPNPESPSPTCG